MPASQRSVSLLSPSTTAAQTQSWTWSVGHEPQETALYLFLYNLLTLELIVIDEYDVSIRQLRTLFTYRCHVCPWIQLTGTREKWRRPYTSDREPLPWTKSRDTICLPSTIKLSCRNLRQHTCHQYVNKVRSWRIETSYSSMTISSKVSKLYQNKHSEIWCSAQCPLHLPLADKFNRTPPWLVGEANLKVSSW